jgi:hypothetical protein
VCHCLDTSSPPNTPLIAIPACRTASAHPYTGPVRSAEFIHFPNADALAVSFDPRTSLSDGASVRLLRTFDGDGPIGEGTEWEGRPLVAEVTKTHPVSLASLSVAEPLIIPRSSLYLSFTSQPGGHDWGYRLAVYPVEHYQDPTDRAAKQEGSRILESPHPVKGGEVADYELRFDDTTAITLRFHQMTALRAEDRVTVLIPTGINSSSSELKMVAMYSGGQKCARNYAGLDGVAPLVVEGGRCIVRVDTTAKGECGEPTWGFKLVAVPTPDTLKAWGGDQGVIIESEHPYPDHYRRVWEVSIPQAQQLEVLFDQRSESERYDVVAFFQDPECTRPVPDCPVFQGWHGSDNFPKNHPLRVPMPRFFVRMTSDHCTNGWGFRLCARPTVGTTDSPHPYLPYTLSYWTVEVPGASVIRISFAEGTDTHPEDRLTFYVEDPRVNLQVRA